MPGLGSGVTLRMLPGKVPPTPMGRLLDRIRLYRHARAVTLLEVKRGGVLAAHHFSPCSRYSPSLLPALPVPFIYGPMPGSLAKRGARSSASEWAIWLGLPEAGRQQTSAAIAFARLAGPIARAMWKRTIARADALVVEARANVPSERLDAVVIPAGIDTQTFSPDGAAPVSGRVVAVGRLLERKGLDVLIRAVAVASRQADQLHLLLAGDGPERKPLEGLAAELGVASRVSFIGRLSRQSLPDLYRSAQVMCHPARWDNFPAAPLEAMACGVPALVSELGSLQEMVGEAGMTHPIGDHETLGAQLVTVVRDERLRSQLSASARERAATHYSWDTVCGAYLELYQSVMILRNQSQGSRPGKEGAGPKKPKTN